VDDEGVLFKRPPGGAYMSIAVNPGASQAQSAPALAEDNSFRDFLLSVLRCGRTRARLIANELDTIGVGLRAGMISSDDAIRAIDDLDAWFLIPEVEEPVR
jgi:hypothetical protein